MFQSMITLCALFFSVVCGYEIAHKGGGLVVLENFWTLEETHQLALASYAFVASTPRSGTTIKVFEEDNPNLLCRAENFLQSDAAREGFLFDKIQQAMTHLYSGNVTLFKEKINYKASGGGAFKPHQDEPAYNWLPPQIHFTAMLSIDASTPENGCLEFAPDYMRELSVDNTTVLEQNERGEILQSIEDRLTFRLFPTSRRDLVLFDSFIPHRSAANLSRNPRQAIFITFNKESEGSWRNKYYETKVCNPDDPVFHLATPTKRDEVSGIGNQDRIYS